MTADQSSEDNDGHQVRAPIGLAGGCALQRAGSRRASGLVLWHIASLQHRATIRRLSGHSGLASRPPGRFMSARPDLPLGLERGVRACLVDAHHARITGNVGADYGS
jgi:hypothetical protein